MKYLVASWMGFPVIGGFQHRGVVELSDSEVLELTDEFDLWLDEKGKHFAARYGLTNQTSCDRMQLT